MTHPIEDRLREAYQAKTAQLTEHRLDQLAERRERGLDDLLDGAPTGELPVLGFEEVPASPRHRWIAAGLAAAAVVALAVGATALVANRLDSHPQPNPPATQVTGPPAPSSTPAPSPSASRTAPSAVPAQPLYLPAGQTGSRGEVPWFVVGSGWRLVLPSTGAGAAAASLYLYDPAGGRYLITDRLPAGATLLAWSPDGTRAMVSSGSSDAFRYQEVTLHSGELTSGFAAPLSNFVSYTQPKGLAVLVAENPNGTRRLVRYSLGGHLEHTYATELPGQGKLYPENALYLPDGARFVSSLIPGPLVLMSNDGRLVRTYEMPKGYEFCIPVKWWTETSVLERCALPAMGFDALYLQPISGGAPTLLTSEKGRYEMGYRNAWPISNGHTLLENTAGCDNGGYDILLEDGTTRPLRGPAGLPSNTPIVNVDGDLVTFQHSDARGCAGEIPHYQLIDYNLVTGATSKLLDGTATLASWPGDL
ncbi:hypothetical protein [Jatrophihabitans sp.]|uniref:hypothetical protein n=1 Tax=Jatrophihabitans sp. TaxID=1932789 RepID=UPI002B9AEE63|nr:hypothetical protein [Jatrophihabitans sp.]